MREAEETTPAPAAHVVAVEVGDELVLLDEDRQTLHALDAVASLLWRCFDGRSTVGEIATDVAESFGIERDRAVEDVAALVRTLELKGLLGAGAADPDLDRNEPAERQIRNPPDP